MRTGSIVKRLLVLLSTTGLVGAAFLATTPGVVGFVANPVCTSANVTSSADPYSATLVGQPVTFTASSTGCNQPAEYQFLLQAPGGTLVSKRAYSTTATYAWNTTGLTIGDWTLVIRARAAGTSVLYDTYYIGTFTLWINHCQVVSTTDDFIAGSPIGSVITFTTYAAPCANDDVGFLLLAPGGKWRVMQPYSPTMTWAWNTTGYAPGLYQIEVWAREKGSLARYDAYDVVSIVLRPVLFNRCQVAFIQSNVPSPQPAGTSIVFTANEQGCGTPAFEFWMLAPGGAWKIVQPYQAPLGFGTTLTYTWGTAGLANGLYRIGIWARDVHKTTTKYEAYANIAYFIGT